MQKEYSRDFIAIKQDVFILLDKAGSNIEEAGQIVRMAIESAFCWLYPSNGDCSYNEQVDKIKKEELKKFIEGFNDNKSLEQSRP